MNQGPQIRASPQSTPPSQPANSAPPPVILHADDDLIRAFRYEDCSWDEVVSAMAEARAESDKRKRRGNELRIKRIYLSVVDINS